MPINPGQEALESEHAWAAIIDKKMERSLPPLNYDYDNLRPELMEVLAYDLQADLYTNLFDDPEADDPFAYRRSALRNSQAFNFAKTYYEAVNILSRVAQFGYITEYDWNTQAIRYRTGIHMIASPPLFGTSDIQYLQFVATRFDDCIPDWLNGRVSFSNTLSQTTYVGYKLQAFALDVKYAFPG